MIHGFFNIGNSCYLNSALQCLINSEIFVNELQNIIKSYKGLSTENLKRYEFLNLLIDMTSATNPVNLKQILSEYDDLFKYNHQQDAHEALMSILNILHKETKINSKHHEKLFKSMNQGWISHIKTFGFSFIDKIFSGQQVSIVKCPCNHIVQTSEIYNSLNLSISNDSKLHTSFGQYFSPDTIPDYECDHCHNKTNATKMISILSFPDILIISLKRFTQQGQKIQSNYEILTELSFNNINIGQLNYKLKVIVNHVGNSLHSGHYTSIIINSGNYYYIDDDKIIQIQPITHSPIVYMFIYERV